MTMSIQQYCLRWNNHQPNFISVFSSLLNSESLVDVTLSAEGRHLQAHKLVLSACSSYFQSLFTINPCQHPIVILKDVKFSDLKVIIDFMYYGEVNVSQEQLPHILKTAEMLKIKGLAEIPVEPASMNNQNSTERAELLTPGDSNWSTADIKRQSLSPSPCPLSPGSKRKRLRKTSTGSGSGSMERTIDEHPPNEVTLTSPMGTHIIKPEPGNYTENNTSQHIHRKQLSTDSSEMRTSSHDENDSPHQITLQIPQQQQEINIQHVESTAPTMEMAGPSCTTGQTVSERLIITGHDPFFQQQAIMGPKRHRFLMRQSRIKRDNDGQTLDGDVLSSHYLSVPHLRVERQVSDPLPALSPPAGYHLTVPGTNVLVKQHSHPLLPSQLTCPCTSPPPISIGQLHILPTYADEMPNSPVLVATTDALGTQETTTTLRVRGDELKRSASSPTQTSTRSSHCPVVRPGPALGCNYCWNTVDAHGRILRRKTKYHCPECQTNLCIVPCFQEYHEKHVGQTDPIALTTQITRIFPKTSSM